MSELNRRNQFRLNYTESHCPIFRMNGIEYIVIDLSEEGMRFQNKPKSKISFNDPISGAISFKDGEVFILRGSITRLSDEDVTIKLKTPMPLRKIVSEQRELIVKYPNKSKAS